MKAQRIKQSILHKDIAQGVFDALEEGMQAVANHGNTAQEIADNVLGLEPALAGTHVRKIARNRAYIARDAHAIVVEHHDHAQLAAARVAERLIAHAARQRAVSHYGHHALAAARKIARPRHAGCRRYGRGCVAGIEGIIRAFLSAGKACQSTELPQGVKAVRATRQQLMGIALMPHVKNQSILGEIKRAVQGDGQFHHPQVGGQMAAVARHAIDDARAQLLRQHGQLLAGKPLDILGRMNPL